MELYNNTEFTPELKDKFASKLEVTGKDNKFPELTKELIAQGYSVKYVYSGNALTLNGNEIMRRNGRKWTIGKKVEITKDSKTELFEFDKVTDEGGSSASYVAQYNGSIVSLKEFLKSFINIVNIRFNK